MPAFCVLISFFRIFFFQILAFLRLFGVPALRACIALLLWASPIMALPQTCCGLPLIKASSYMSSHISRNFLNGITRRSVTFLSSPNSFFYFAAFHKYRRFLKTKEQPLGCSFVTPDGAAVKRYTRVSSRSHQRGDPNSRSQHLRSRLPLPCPKSLCQTRHTVHPGAAHPHA